MAEVNNKVIKITVDTDKAKIKIEGVEGYFRKAETAAKALNKVLDQNTQKWGRTEAALSQQISSLKDLRAKTAGTTEEYQRQTKEIDKLQAEYEQLTTAQGKVSKGMGSMQSSAGIAGATVSELGRTISDMPYGITAITNNISQLGSMFAILVQKTGSVQKAFQSLFATLRASPALLALLAFQAAVAVLDVFAQNAKKAKSSMDEFAKATGGAATELKIALKILNDENIAFEDKKELLDNINEEYSDMDIRIGSNNKLRDESVAAIKKEISALVRLAQVQALVSQIRKTQEEIAVIEATPVEEFETFFEKFLAPFTPSGIKNLGDRLKADAIFAKQQLVNGLTEQLEKDDLYKLLLGNEDDLSNGLNKLEEFLKKWKEKREDYETKSKLSLINLEEKRVIEQATKLNKGVELSEEKLYDIRKYFSDKRVKLIDDEYKEVLKLQQKAFNEELDLIEDNNKQIDSLLKDITAKRKTEDPIRFSDYDFDDLDVDIAIDELLDKNKKADQARIDSVNRMADAAQAFGDILSGIAGIMDAEFQKQMDLEQNKTTALNNQLRERLANEQLSANERKNIQSQISANDEALRIKQEAIAKKRFKTEKAMRISIGLVDTAASALKAYGSQLIVGDPSSLIRAQVAAGLATVLGLAQVAMISKQQFVGSASASPAGLGGTTGSGGGVQAPDFNIVGQSSSNQIAAAVQGQFSQPIKAYVVSKDVSTAQEMDRNIIGSASLG